MSDIVRRSRRGTGVLLAIVGQVLTVFVATISAGGAALAQTAWNALPVARLPPCTVGRQGRSISVSDSDGDCQTGGGSTYRLCICDPNAAGTGWLVVGPQDGAVGTFAGAATSGGPATTALALDADPADCNAGSAPSGMSATGAASSCTAYLPIAGGTLTGSVTGPWFDGSFVRGMAGATPKAALNRGTEPGGRSVGVAIAQDRDLCWSSSASADDGFDTCLYRSAANVLELTDGSTGSSRLQVRGIRLVPRSSPVSACDASTRGLSYYDSDDDDFCDCVGSGYRSRGGAGSCN